MKGFPARYGGEPALAPNEATAAFVRAREHSDSGSGLPQSKQTFDTMMIACSEEIYENSVHIKIFEVPNLLLALRM
nr:hypothetical protein [Brevundimonas diminuta]